MVCIPITEEEHIARAVSFTRDSMEIGGFGAAKQCMISTAVSELATNVYVHAGQGTVTIETIDEAEKTGIKVTVEDHGPGIEDLDKAMMEGYSTAGSLGVGLPGTKRLVDEFSIQSRVNEGTTAVILAWLDN